MILILLITVKFNENRNYLAFSIALKKYNN